LAEDIGLFKPKYRAFDAEVQCKISEDLANQIQASPYHLWLTAVPLPGMPAT